VAFDLLRHADPIAMAQIELSKTMFISGPTAKSSVYRRILADVTGYRVVYATRSSEAPGGDALIAALASRQIPDASTIKKWLRLDDAVVTEPDEKAHKRYTEYFRKVWSPNYVATKNVDDTITSWTLT